MTFSMMYFYNERYLLPFSHDETVHGKKTILDKMNGAYEEKFPQGRALYLYMAVHPGKKLNFMGNEIGQLREWDEKRSQDWEMRRYPNHDAFYHYIAELNRLYLAHSALWAWDDRPDGFRWLDCHEEEKCVYVMERRSGTETLRAALNFSAQVQTVSVPSEKREASVLLDTDWEAFGGHTPREETVVDCTEEEMTFRLAPFSGTLLSCPDVQREHSSSRAGKEAKPGMDRTARRKNREKEKQGPGRQKRFVEDRE